MLEREVTDVAISTFSSLLLIQLILSPSDNVFITLGILGCIVQISLNFLHLIIKQLNRLSDRGSFFVVIVNAICLFFVFSAFIFGNPESVEAFWDVISNGYFIFAYVLLLANLILIIISRNAQMVELSI